MSTEHNKALARRVTEEGLNQQNPALFDELCAPNFVFHNASRTIQSNLACSLLYSASYFLQDLQLVWV
jgi:hypothetical protein